MFLLSLLPFLARRLQCPARREKGKPRLPQSGSRGSHAPTRFARLLILDKTDGVPEVPTVVVGGIHIAAVEVQVVGVVGIAGRT